MDLEKNITNVKNLKDQCLEQAYTIITNVYGVVPEKFNFEYTDKNGKYHIDKNITPKELYNKYIDIDLLNDYIDLFIIEYDDFIRRYIILNEKYNYKYLELAAEDMNYLEEMYDCY